MCRAKAIIACYILLLTPSVAVSQVLINDVSKVNVELDGFRGAGLSPSPTNGELDSNIWRISLGPTNQTDYNDTELAPEFARGTSQGGVTLGGIYAFEVAPNSFALGVQPTGNIFTGGFFELRLKNNTTDTIEALCVRSTLWFYNDQDRSTAVSLRIDALGPPATSYVLFNFATPSISDSQTTWSSFPFRELLDLSSSPIEPGQELFIRWLSDDLDASSGARDEIAINNIAFQAGTCPDPIFADRFSGSVD